MGVLAPTKSTLRQRCLARRSALSADERTRLSGMLCMRLAACDAVRNATALVAYVPIAAEVDPGAVVRIVRRSGRAIYLPDWPGATMGFRAVSDQRPLAGAGTGVVILVPGVAFDARGARLGRGAGWYDRVLPRYPRALKIGLAFEEQMVPNVPQQAWDVPMDVIVTDGRLLSPRVNAETPRGVST